MKVDHDSNSYDENENDNRSNKAIKTKFSLYEITSNLIIFVGRRWAESGSRVRSNTHNTSMTSPELDLSPKFLFQNQSKIDDKNGNCEFYHGNETYDNYDFGNENEDDNENENEDEKENENENENDDLRTIDSYEHDFENIEIEKQEKKKKKNILPNIIDERNTSDDVINFVEKYGRDDVLHNGANGFQSDTEIEKQKPKNVSTKISSELRKQNENENENENKNVNENENLVSTPILKHFRQIDTIQDSDNFIKKDENYKMSKESEKNEIKPEIRQRAANEQILKEVRPKKFRKSSRSLPEQGSGIKVSDPIIPKYESLKSAIKIRWVRITEIKIKECHLEFFFFFSLLD